MSDSQEELEEKSRKEPVKVKKRVVKRKLLIALIIIILAILLTGIGVKIKSRETLLDFGYKDVGVLVTQEWYGRILEDSSTDRKVFKYISVPFTESRLIFSIDVEVLAGVDFEQIQYEMKDKKIIITLPHSEVYKAYEVNETFKSYLEDESWFNNISSTEKKALEDNIVEKGKEQAIGSGLLDKADENAQKIIQNMIRGNKKTKDYEVEFKYK